MKSKLIVRELAVRYLHDPRCIERSGEYKQEGFKSNLVIFKSGMEVRILSRIKWHYRYTISPLKARKDWCASASHCFSTVLGYERCFLVRKLYQETGGHMLTPKIGQIPRFAMQSRRTGETGCKPVRSVWVRLSKCQLDCTIA